MLDEETKEAIANYVLDQHNHDRLRLVIGIHNAFDTIRVRVIRDFSQQIVKSLEGAMPAERGWSIRAKDLLENPLRIYTGLTVRHEVWNEGLEVGIDAESWGANNWIIGVRRKQGYENDLLTAQLTKTLGAGRGSSACLWYHFFGDRAEFGDWRWGNWTDGETIIAMREGAEGDYGRRICGRIIEIAKAVDGFFTTRFPQ